MYWLDGAIKRDPVRRWNLPDRIFFGRGACHILAGSYLKQGIGPHFYAEHIVPALGFSGSHIYVTDGRISFDFHGYALRERLLAHHWRGWRKRYPTWSGSVERVAFDLLDTKSLNARKMLGPDQYGGSALARAQAYLARIDHSNAYARTAHRAY
ncbi:hypothetical protein [uncultured Shimia sp.]|uniref:hypothetical protein n=1 Tax=uncultured Shimia sp. TaxID=573152 RepID=UPI002609ACA3|nr:hypothetical protein [uncultured Shimia sp.]